MVAEYCKISHFQKISEIPHGGTHGSGHQINLIPLGVHLWPLLVPVGGIWSSPLVPAAVERDWQSLVPKGAMGSHPGSSECACVCGGEPVANPGPFGRGLWLPSPPCLSGKGPVIISDYRPHGCRHMVTLGPPEETFLVPM